MPELYRPAYIHDYDIEITQGQDWVMGFRCLPTTDQGVLYLEDTTGYTARMVVRAPNQDGDAVLDVTSTSGEIILGFTPPDWDAATVYGLGQKVVPNTLNGFVYEVTVAGTSHAVTEPTWPTTLATTVVDNTVTWRAETDDSLVCNIYIAIPASTTEALTAWGRGVWSLEVIDTFTHTWFYIDGAAYLRQESTYGD
jgi:hypothetical protein